jgi:hypothetical protein
LPYQWPTPEGTFRTTIKKEKKNGTIQSNNPRA